ncbi:MAG: excinuclease ABC subunit UvrC [Paludibacteraceae bacterium]|nr:excinuclease ABC subunit UvrC [Paludibacteraceae bacterium]
MEKEISQLKQIVLSLPESPGVYQYVNKENEIIYVGKAVNLKRRVSSYFNKYQTSNKVRALVKQIADIKYIVVPSEQDALLLENSLIKKHQPRYNILLKDDKTYPWICIKNEPFPRVFYTRRYVHDGSLYYGPYTYLPAMKTVLDLIHNIYGIRTCNNKLTEDAIKSGKYKVCLDYHIKKCKGCCEGYQTEEEYRENIKEIKLILKGEMSVLEKYILDEMGKAAEEMRFEDAQKMKEKLYLLSQYKSKNTIVSPILTNIDVFSIEIDDNNAYINFLKVMEGTISQAYTFEYKIQTEEEESEILASAIVEMRQKFKSLSREIIVPYPISFELDNVTITVPQKGDKKKLLDLSIKNVKQYRFDRIKQAEKFNPEQRAMKLLTELQKVLGLKEVPHQIECFDNSNISGSDAVAGCVVYKNAKPSKKDYRTYNIKTVEGPDDYGSMQEVVYRRYSRLVNEGEKLPNLIIVDGGVGQMECVREVIEDKLNLYIPIAGLAKDDKHRTKELLYGFPPLHVEIQPNHSLFRFLAGIQDEVHRFAISFHRNKRSKSQIHSALDDINGIGEKTKDTLIKKFKSVKRIKEQTEEELAEVIGKAKAKIIFDNLHQD